MVRTLYIIALDRQEIDEGSHRFDHALAFSRTDLEELELFLSESQDAGQFADLLEELCCPPAAKLVVTLLRRASDEHHPISALFEGLQDDARPQLTQTVHLERADSGWIAETLLSCFLEALMSIPVAGKNDDSAFGFPHALP
jgi:hypothetical protein